MFNLVSQLFLKCMKPSESILKLRTILPASNSASTTTCRKSLFLETLENLDFNNLLSMMTSLVGQDVPAFFDSLVQEVPLYTISCTEMESKLEAASSVKKNLVFLNWTNSNRQCILHIFYYCARISFLGADNCIRAIKRQRVKL